jgi:hypothetical protein
MRLLIIILLSAILMSCSKGTKNSLTDKVDSIKVIDQDTVYSKDEFMSLVELLPKVNLPFEIYCEKCCDHPEFDRDNELVKKYIPEGANPVGLIFKNENHVGVLATYAGDMLIPAVLIFDLTGRKTDEKTFMTGWCGRDIDYLGLQYFKINIDLTLNSTDTSYSFILDDKTQEIIDTVKTEILTTDFYVSADGKIVPK